MKKEARLTSIRGKGFIEVSKNLARYKCKHDFVEASKMQIVECSRDIN